MATILKIDGYDLQPYLRVGEGEGFDPMDPDRRQPQFAEAGLTEGQPLVSINEDNGEFVIPVHLNPAKSGGGFPSTRQGLNDLVIDLNRRLAVAQQIEWADDGLTASTYYDIEFVRFEPEYKFRRAGAKWLSGTIRAWTKPYGHTGTTRLVGSVSASGPIVNIGAVPSIRGDVAARAQFDVKVATLPGPAFVLAGILPHASYRVEHTPSVLEVDPSPHTGFGIRTGTVSVSSGAVASRYMAFAVSATRANVEMVGGGGDTSGFTFRINLPIPTTYTGRNRVLVMARSRTSNGYYIVMKDKYGNALGPTVVATNQDWAIYDLGVFNPDGIPRIASEFVNVVAGGIATNASGVANTLIASPGFLVTDVFTVPDETSVVVAEAAAENQMRTFTFDGVNNRIYSATSVTKGVVPMSQYQRGGVPLVPPSGAAGFFAIAAQTGVDDFSSPGARTMGTIVLGVSLQERFTYGR
jgi:hypothetical protein